MQPLQLSRRLKLIPRLNLADVPQNGLVAQHQRIADAHLRQQLAAEGIALPLQRRPREWLPGKHVHHRPNRVQLEILVAIKLDLHAVWNSIPCDFISSTVFALSWSLPAKPMSRQTTPFGFRATRPRSVSC